MASVYKSYIDDIESGGFAFPYHIHAIYQIVTNQDLKPSPLPKLEGDNVTSFTGSLSAGDLNSSTNQPQVDQFTSSSAFGRGNEVSSDNSFVFGKDSIEVNVDNSFHIANGDKGKSNYVLSTKTEPNSGTNNIFLDENSPEAMYSDIMIAGVEALTDGVRFWGVWEFSASWRVETFTSGFFTFSDLVLQDSEKTVKKPETFRATQVNVDLQGSSVFSVNTIVINDNRDSGNKVNWVAKIENSENGFFV